MKKRTIAILSDIHGLLEPLVAALDDIEKRGITEIYSLGDNIGLGPNPKEVMELLKERNVISIAGNWEEYITLGKEPFNIYFDKEREENLQYTLSQLSEEQKYEIATYPHSIELLIGGKKIVLCHFSSDVRFDYREHSSYHYQFNIKLHRKAYKQFLYTNSKEQIYKLSKILSKDNKEPEMKGYVSASNDPLFGGKEVNYYDAIIQGHVHFKIYEQGKSTNFYTIRALGIGYDKDPVDSASYTILSEEDNGYNLEEVLVKYDRDNMKRKVLSMECSNDKLRKYIEIYK